MMTQLVKARVTRDDPISKLVKAFSIRHVSGSVKLNELGRILTRNGFALVDKTKFVTTDDLVEKLSPKKSQPSDGGSSMLNLAATFVAGAAMAAAATFMLLNKCK